MFVSNLELYFSLSGFSSSEENLLMSNGFSIADMGVNSHGIFEGKKILKTITYSKNYLKIITKQSCYELKQFFIWILL